MLVAGASGFAGALAASLVWRHPRLELAAATSRGDAGARLDRLYPRYRAPVQLAELDLERAAECEAAIVAYPHGAAAELIGELRRAGLAVVDVSADFRLHDPATYQRIYGEHGAPELLADAVYGLPELHRERIAGAQLVANPGCYSTYGVDGHRHAPEIVQELRELGASAPVSFVPHLLPLDQGLLASCYVRLARNLVDGELRSLYEERYADEPFVELAREPPGVRDVRDTNFCRVHVSLDEAGKALAFAAIDNLWKGAAGQAIQNLNLMLGLPETEGLE